MERGYSNESKTERILTIYQMLCDGEYVNKASIADMFQVNPRSVQRDIDDLRAYFANQSISNSSVGPPTYMTVVRMVTIWIMKTRG